MSAIRLQSYAIDAPDPAVLARFYADLLDWEITRADEEWVTVSPPDGGVPLDFQRADAFTAPTWPDPAVPQQAHLDLQVDSYDEPEARVLELGGRKIEGDEAHPGFRVYLDPAGHPFCLCKG